MKLPPETLREFLQGECADDLELWVFNIAFFFWGLALGLTTAQPVAFNFLNFFLMCLYISSPWSLPENSWLRFGITLPIQLVKARKKGYWNPERIAEIEFNVAVHRLREETDAMLKASQRIYELEIQLFDSRLKLDEN